MDSYPAPRKGKKNLVFFKKKLVKLSYTFISLQFYELTACVLYLLK